MGKLLSVLGVPDAIQGKLPPDVFQAETLLDGMQRIYANAPESPKKDLLAVSIAESVRVLLAKVQPYTLDEKKEQKVKKEEKKLPDEPAPAPQPQPQPQPQPKSERKQKAAAPPSSPEKPKEQEKKEEKQATDEPMTCQEIKDAIKGLKLLSQMGDEEATSIIKELKIKLKNQNCK